MGKRDQREVRNRLKVLLVNLLKWTAQPGLRYAESGTSSWLGTIMQSPSLERHARESLDEVFRKAVKTAVYETRLPRSKFPTTCPFAFEQVMDDAFLPE